jgi:glycerol uptake facilitator-like aquaporin
VAIWGFAGQTIVLNSARDIGGRITCSMVYGAKCWNGDSAFTALAALTNIPATILGAAIQSKLHRPLIITN